MKAAAVWALGLAVCAGLTVQAQDKADAPKLEGKYTLVSGKKNGTAVTDEMSKKAEYIFEKDKIIIKGGDGQFVMSYKLDPKATPIGIDMEIVEGPEGTKGSKAEGIVELKGDELKLAYSMDAGKRPKDFSGKEGHLFVFKKAK
jgi:uncharacterized protein (TIGR03067 family)